MLYLVLFMLLPDALRRAIISGVEFIEYPGGEFNFSEVLCLLIARNNNLDISVKADIIRCMKKQILPELRRVQDKIKNWIIDYFGGIP